VLQHDGHEINRLIEGVTRGYTYPNDQVSLLGLIIIGVIKPYGCVEECHTPYLANLIQFISLPQCSGTSCLRIYDVLIMYSSILMSLKLSFSSFFVIYVTIYFYCI
jgi:hypothetical protein